MCQYWAFSLASFYEAVLRASEARSPHRAQQYSEDIKARLRGRGTGASLPQFGLPAQWSVVCSGRVPTVL
jgi:hypothetical protein